MSEATSVIRTLDTDLAPDELWSLVADGAAWADWLVDDADVTVAPGGGGAVVDEGVARTVRVDRLDDDRGTRRVGFTWWPDDRPHLASAVELTVIPAGAGSRLRVVETFAATASTQAVATCAWNGRLLVLGALTLLVRLARV
jgi:hypothetical protein